MKKVAKSILEPLFWGTGVSLALYIQNQSFPAISYLSTIPFFILIGRPMGYIWNKVSNKINEGVFPSEMKNYRQMYLVSKRAILYDICLNHIGYHSIFCSILLTYSYFLRKLYQKQQKVKPFGQVFQSSGLKLVRVRALISIVSILSEYWIGYINLIKTDGKIMISNKTKRFLLMKQLILTLTWHTQIIRQLNSNFINKY